MPLYIHIPAAFVLWCSSGNLLSPWDLSRFLLNKCLALSTGWVFCGLADMWFSELCHLRGGWGGTKVFLLDAALGVCSGIGLAVPPKVSGGHRLSPAPPQPRTSPRWLAGGSRSRGTAAEPEGVGAGRAAPRPLRPARRRPRRPPGPGAGELCPVGAGRRLVAELAAGSPAVC